jgi:hypothetical protein
VRSPLTDLNAQETSELAALIAGISTVESRIAQAAAE